MPARHFFVMLRSARQIRSYYFSTWCDIAAIPMCKGEYRDRLKDHFDSLLAREAPRSEEPARPPVEGLSGDAGKYAMMSLFANLKRRAARA